MAWQDWAFASVLAPCVVALWVMVGFLVYVAVKLIRSD